MIEQRFYNMRAFKLASNVAKYKHRTVYYLKILNDLVYAVYGLDEVTIQQIPAFYTEYMYFNTQPKQFLIKNYKDRIKFCNILEFLAVSCETT